MTFAQCKAEAFLCKKFKKNGTIKIVTPILIKL